MKYSEWLRGVVGALLFILMGNFPTVASDQPNVVMIFTDDQGYSDVGCFGAEGFETPNLDRMATEGMKFTDFYVAQAVCGASRAALLTGCYPNRIGMLGAPSSHSNYGIHADEMLLPELVKQKGYTTAMYGKWHLGHRVASLPMQHGFDDYFGLPYSNDMWPNHPTAGDRFPDLPTIEKNDIVEYNSDQTQLTSWYTERAVKFIRQNRNTPFFLYVAHSMPHVPLFVSKKHEGVSEQGTYGDVISEIDWSVGRILQTLKRCGIDDKTLVIFTSDNGPWLSYGNHAGSCRPLREGKGTTWEGGMREPCIMRWPGKIPAGTVCSELAATIDIFPTVAHLTGAEPSGNKIDGKNIWPLMSGQLDAKSPHKAYFYYWGRHLQAVRSGDWKLHFPHGYRTLVGEGGKDGLPSAYKNVQTPLALFNLKDDIGELTNVAETNPDVVKELKLRADEIRAQIGDSAKKMQGTELRQPQLFD